MCTLLLTSLLATAIAALGLVILHLAKTRKSLRMQAAANAALQAAASWTSSASRGETR